MLLPRGAASAFCGALFFPVLSQPGLFGVGKFGQHHHRLHRPRPAEHIDALNFFGGVSAFGEQLGVAGEGRRAAGNIDHALGRGGDNGLQDGGIAALARGIEHDHIRAEAVFHQLGQQLFGCADVELGVGNAVARGVFIRVLNGFRHDFDADDFFGLLRQQQRDRARAAVRIHDGFGAGQAGVFQREAVESLGLLGIHLEEGERRNGEAQAAERVLHGGFAPENADVRAQNDVGAAAVDAQADAAQAGDGGAQQLDQPTGLRDIRTGDDDDDHQLAGGRRTGHNMADEAASGLLIVGGDAVFAHPIQDGLCGPGGILALNGAPVFGQGDEIVAARREEAAGRRAVRLRDGVCALIAVAEGMRHAPNGRHLDGKPADALEEILHLLALEGKGGLVGRVLADTAAAALVDGAERLGAAGALFQQLFHAAKGIALFRLDDAHQRAFAGQQTGDKHGHALVAADALRILTEGIAGHFKALVFGEHGGFSFSIRMGLLRMNSPTKC